MRHESQGYLLSLLTPEPARHLIPATRGRPVVYCILGRSQCRTTNIKRSDGTRYYNTFFNNAQANHRSNDIHPRRSGLQLRHEVKPSA